MYKLIVKKAQRHLKAYNERFYTLVSPGLRGPELSEGAGNFPCKRQHCSDFAVTSRDENGSQSREIQQLLLLLL